MRLRVNGVTLDYDEAGEGQAFLALHGGPGMGSRGGNWRAFGPLRDAYRVVAYDHRGCGRSDGGEPYDHAQWVADAEGLRQALDLGPIVLFGISYGGFLALEYALAHPGNVRALILSDTAASAKYHEIAKRNAMASLPGIPSDELDRLFSGRVRDDADFRRLFSLIQPLYRVDRPDSDTAQRALDAIAFRHETHNWAFAKSQPNYDVSGRLGEIRMPTLVTVGRQDWITPVEAANELAHGIPGARLEIFEHSGHAPQDEEPDAYLRLVRSFLADAL